MLKAKLEIVGGAKASEIELRRLPVTIGRAREATIKLPHNLVSRLHCEILEKNGQLFVNDLNSLNGTYVNNDRIFGSQVLLPEQLLTLGNVTFRAVYEIGDNDQLPNANDSDTGHWQHGETIPVALPVAHANGKRAFKDCESTVPALFDGELEPEGDTDERKAADLAGARFASEPDRDQFIHLVDDDIASGHRSICLAEMLKLPQSTNGAASFSGGIAVNGAAQAASFEADTVQIDLGGEDSGHQEASQSAIDSFIRKLPR